MEMGSSVEEVREDACGILEEMSQNLQLGFIRLMAYTLTKVIKRLFTSVYVNMEGLNMVRNIENLYCTLKNTKHTKIYFKGIVCVGICSQSLYLAELIIIVFLAFFFTESKYINTYLNVINELVACLSLEQTYK